MPILNWGLISDSDNRGKRYARLSEGVFVCDRIGSLRPRSRRGIWAPDRKSPNATIYRPGRSADSELGPQNGIPRNQRLVDRLRVPIPNWCHVSDSDARAESYAQFFR